MKPYFIVVDMQNDFISGALGTPEAQAIVPQVVNRIQVADKRGYQIIFTMDTHEADYLSTQEGRQLPVEHCLRETTGWMLDHRIESVFTPSMQLFEKPAFGSIALADMICEDIQKSGAPDGKGSIIEMCGVCTDICVVSNALILKARLPEAEIRVYSDLCAGVTVRRHEAALTIMRACQIDII